MVELPAMTKDEWARFDHSMKMMEELQAPAPAAAPQKAAVKELDWPPGVTGALAQAIYHNSARPVQTVAIATALAILAGVCGRGWITYTNAGLNLYLAVVARSGIGKEAIGDAIPTLVRDAVKAGERGASSFFTFLSMASGPGLFKAIADAPYACLLHVDGEFGHNVQFMATDKTGPHATLRQQMTRMYSKSAPNSMAGGIQRAKADDSIEIEGSASYSIIGDTTPSTFYEALNGKMMADGFLSRFVVIEYHGQRPPLNESRQPFHPDAVRWFCNIVGQAVQRFARDPQLVPPDADALQHLRDFDRLCDQNLNATENEARRQMWNRAHLNALKVATLLAVADSYGTTEPVVTAAHADWAIALIMRNIANMQTRLDGGDVGEGDGARERKLAAVLRHYMLHPLAASYKIPEAMRQASIVPVSYLLNRTAQHAAFYTHKLGSNWALRDALRSMVEAGYLMEVKKDATIEFYNYHGQAYRVLRLPNYDEGGV